MRFSRPRSRHHDPRPPALSPGSLIHVGERLVNEVTFRVIDYDSAGVRELDSPSVEECIAFEGRNSPTWIMVTGLHDTTRIGALLEAYDIHPLVQDDILNTNHLAKVEDFDEYLFVTVSLMTPGKEGAPYDLQHFSAILTDRVILTFQETHTRIFDPIMARLRDGKGRLRTRGPDYLLWALLDAVLDQYLKVLDNHSDTVAEMDERLTSGTNPIQPEDLYRVRADTHALYRIVRPIREVAVTLQHSESTLLTPGLSPFLRDFYDHSWHAIETAERLREEVTAIRDYHSAVLNQRMNEVMKVLAAISTIFLPLTFLAGVYGMNFNYLPELHWKWAYPVLWIVFILIAAGLLYFFRRRKWL